MKKVKAILLILIIVTAFSACTDDTEVPSSADMSQVTESTTQAPTNKNENKNDITKKEQDNKTEKETTTKKTQGNGIFSNEDKEKLENSQVETYFSDNPENIYISKIANKYNVPKNKLIALVKVNAELPGATVLQFSGKTDSNGELLMTYDELEYVYEIRDDINKITRASKSGVGNNGVNFVESKITIALIKEYVIPELPDLKENKRYPE